MFASVEQHETPSGADNFKRLKAVTAAGVVTAGQMTQDAVLEQKIDLHVGPADASPAGAVLARAGRLGPWRRRVFGAATALLILFWAGLTLSRNRDYRSELSYFRATEMADGSVARVHLALAGVYEGLRQPAAAEAEFRAALRLWPRYRKAQLLFAGFLMDKGRAQESEALLRSAGALSPGDPVIALRLGVCLLEQGHAEQAMEPLRAALEETNWASPLALYHLALACRRSGRLPEAGRLEERLRLTSPDLADLFRSRNPRIIRPAFF